MPILGFPEDEHNYPGRKGHRLKPSLLAGGLGKTTESTTRPIINRLFVDQINLD